VSKPARINVYLLVVKKGQLRTRHTAILVVTEEEAQKIIKDYGIKFPMKEKGGSKKP
jgi:hypothetical protein